MIRYLLKYNLLSIIPTQKLFFLASDVPQGTKLSRELLMLNYEKKSPFKNPYICYYQEKSALYVWFCKTKQFKELLVVPENFIIYKALQELPDGMFLFDGQVQLLLVLQQKRLVAQFVVSDASEVVVAQEEYNCKNVTHLSEKQYQDYFNEGLQKVTLNDLRQFANINLSKEKVQNFVMQKLAYPFVVVLAFYMLVTYAQGYFMQQTINTLTQKYQTLKKQNTKTKEAVRHHNQTVRKLNSFVKHELSNINPLQVLYDLNKIILPTNKAKIIYLDIASNLVNLRIQTKNDDGIKYLQRLNKLAYVKEVIITNTFKRRDGVKVFSYAITLKKGAK